MRDERMITSSETRTITHVQSLVCRAGMSDLRNN